MERTLGFRVSLLAREALNQLIIGLLGSIIWPNSNKKSSILVLYFLYPTRTLFHFFSFFCFLLWILILATFALTLFSMADTGEVRFFKPFISQKSSKSLVRMSLSFLF